MDDRLNYEQKNVFKNKLGIYQKNCGKYLNL